MDIFGGAKILSTTQTHPMVGTEDSKQDSGCGLTKKRASLWCLVPMDSGLIIEPTKMEEILSMLLGVVEEVLPDVPIRNHSVIC